MRVVNLLFDDRYGGPQKRVIQVAGALKEHGVETAMSLPVGDGNAADVARREGIEVLRISFERTPRPRDVRKVLRWGSLLPRDVRRFMGMFRRERPDLVHVNGAFFVAPAVAAKLARVPLVWHLNDTIVPAKVAPVLGALVRVLADRIVVAAEAVAWHYGVAVAPHEVIHAPVDVHAFDEHHRRDGGVRRVGIIGNRNPLKGLEYFVRAAALVRERLAEKVEFVLVGARLETHADYALRIDALIDELGLRSVVRDHGFVSPVAPILADLDVLVLSSTTEASPIAVLEGMAAGVPVVATDVGGVREMLLVDPDNPAGLVVPPRDPESLALAILETLEHPKEAARMGLSGRRIAEKHFSLAACTRRHLKVYRDLWGAPDSSSE